MGAGLREEALVCDSQLALGLGGQWDAGVGRAAGSGTQTAFGMLLEAGTTERDALHRGVRKKI